MTGYSALYGLEMPDKRTELNLGAADAERIIEETYRAWLDSLECYETEFTYDSKRIVLTEIRKMRERIYNHACEIIGPYRNKLSGTIQKECIDIMMRNPQPFDTSGDCCIGLYMSALLNKTNLDKLPVTPFKGRYDGIGYHLKEGKILEVSDGAVVFEIGRESSGGVVVNHGRVGWMGTGSSGGIFIDCNHAVYAGLNASDGIFLLLKEEPEKSPLSYKEGNCYKIGPKLLKKDTELLEMTNSIVDACAEPDIPKVHALARKIDAHVRNKYPKNQSS